MEHPEMTVVTGTEALFTGLGDMVPQSVATAKTGHVSDTTFAIAGSVVIIDQLNSSWWTIGGVELNSGICQENGPHSPHAHIRQAALACQTTDGFSLELRMKRRSRAGGRG